MNSAAKEWWASVAGGSLHHSTLYELSIREVGVCFRRLCIAIDRLVGLPQALLTVSVGCAEAVWASVKVIDQLH